MIVREIQYSKKFIKEIKKLSQEILDVAIKEEEIFRINPLHPSLRLHELHGKFKGIWSISLTNNYRIIFELMPNGDILFISVGKHDIYKYL